LNRKIKPNKRNMRHIYQPIIKDLQSRIDAASRDWVERGDDRARHEYDMLVQEVMEIKEAIINAEYERKHHK